MHSKMTRAQRLSKMAAQIKHAPDLFDQTCSRAVKNIENHDAAKVAELLGPQPSTVAGLVPKG
jgi:hypothetical protein